MKKLGFSISVLFLSLLAGFGAWASPSGPTRPRSRKKAVTLGADRRDITRRGEPSDHPERGDVPGWVMITLMTAVLVAALLALAGPALEAMFNQAMDKVGK
jgi:hypothetical protein